VSTYTPTFLPASDAAGAVTASSMDYLVLRWEKPKTRISISKDQRSGENYSITNGYSGILPP
jgi:hypothetical protein